MLKSCVRLACALAFALTVVGAARADIRVKKTTTFGRPSAQGDAGGEATPGRGPTEFTEEEMIKGRRERNERTIQMPIGQKSISMKQVSVTQCDLKRRIDIGDATRKYYIEPIGGVDETDMSAAGSAPSASDGRATRGGVVTYTRTVTDTGERKQIFGFTARHLKTRTSVQPSPDACQKTASIQEQDGWYIDLEVDFSCIVNQPPPQMGMMGRQGCQDRIVYRNSGALKLGYPVEETTRTYAPDGKTVQNEYTIKVTELSRAPLDPSLFDIPAGYTQASNQGELVDQQAMMQAVMSANGEGGGESGGGSSSMAETGGMSASSGGMSAPAMSGATGPKQPGTIRVGVARIGNKTTQSVDAGTMRATLIESLSGSGVEAIPLNESAPDAAQAEAKQKECDFVLFTDVSGLKQASKLGGMFGRATGVGSGSLDRYEAKVDYTLSPTAGGAPMQSSASAKEDGGADASINSALRKEAQAVLSRVHK